MRTLLPLVALLLSGCAATSMYQPDPAIGAAATRNEQLGYDARTVMLALEMYATDHDGVYPEPARLHDCLSGPSYLPGRRYPADPWGDPAGELTITALEVPKDGASMPRFEELAISSLPMGAGRRGTLVYVVQAGHTDYSLYAIGETLGQPRVVLGLGTQKTFLKP